MAQYPPHEFDDDYSLNADGSHRYSKRGISPMPIVPRDDALPRKPVNLTVGDDEEEQAKRARADRLASAQERVSTFAKAIADAIKIAQGRNETGSRFRSREEKLERLATIERILMTIPYTSLKLTYGKWQPIATAPTDGTEVDLCNMTSTGVPVIRKSCHSTNGGKDWFHWTGHAPTYWSALINMTHWVLPVPLIDDIVADRILRQKRVDVRRLIVDADGKNTTQAFYSGQLQLLDELLGEAPVPARMVTLDTSRSHNG